MSARLVTLTATALASSLLLATSATAGFVTDGATLGGGSATNWSSDLGLVNHYGVYSDSINRGPGGTTNSRLQGSLYSGESLTNFTGPLTNFGDSRGVLTSSVTIDVAPGGSVNGMVEHARFDATVPSVGSYGMFAESSIETNFGFSGGIAGQQNYLYWAYQWEVTTDFAPDSDIIGDFTIDIGGNTSGNYFRGNPLLLANRSRTAFGVFALRGGNTADTINNGNGYESQQLRFLLGNGSGSRTPGGSAAIDVWYQFSDTPIDHVDLPGVPEPATWGLMLVGFGGLGAALRRLRAQIVLTA